MTSARWFAGKGRTVARVATVERLEPPDAGGAAVELVDVSYTEGDSERYALALREGAECAGDDPLWPALARAAGVEVDGGARFLAEDLSNTVVVLGERVVLKLFRRPEPGPHPEPELLRALEGSPHAPRVLGTLEHEGAMLCVLLVLVEGTPVGWEGLISRLAGGEYADGEPAELARVTALLHATLAERLGVAEATVSKRPEVTLPPDLSHLAPTVASGLEPLDRARVEVQRVHGDLHVAQFLRTGGGLVVVDWEGEPGLPLSERVRRRPALRDLASLRLSLAHAARAAHRRTRDFDWRAWATAARREALDAYAQTARPVDRELLLALELQKELSELSYAERWLPEWLYAPRAVLPFVIEEMA